MSLFSLFYGTTEVGLQCLLVLGLLLVFLDNNFDLDSKVTKMLKGSLRPQGLILKNDRFICTDSEKNIKTNKFTSIHYLNLIL